MLVAFIPGISTGLVNLKNDREFFQPLVKDEANIEKSLFKKFEEETLDEIEDEEEAMGDLMKGLMDEEGLLDDASEEEDTESEADADSDGDMEALMKEIPLVDEEENENE